MAEPNSVYSQALSASIANYRNIASDDVTANNALLTVLDEKGNIDPFDGGTELTEQILFAEVSATGWYTGAEALPVSANKVLTTANFAIKQHYSAITEDGLEEIQNAGESKMIDLVKAKIEAGMATSKNAVSTALFGSNTEFDGKAIGGFQHLVADNPAVGTIGGINAANDAFWRPIVFDFSVAVITPSATTILPAMNTAIRQTNRGKDATDLIVAGDTYFGYFDDALQANQRFVQVSKKVIAGFTAFEYKGANVIHDPHCNAARMYGLNTDYVKFRPSKVRNFKIGARKQAVNQDAWLYPIYFAGNVTIKSRKRHWVLIA